MTSADARDPYMEPTIKQSIAIASGAEAEPTVGAEDSTLPFRPLFRPPVALICLIHDDGTSLEWQAMRCEKFQFGRTEGDLRIPHDSQISGVHCELTRRFVDGVWQWYLRDLESRNGTFVKLSKALLSHKMHLMLGCHRYRFETASPVPPKSPPSSPQARSTGAWQMPDAEDMERTRPSLVRLTPEGDGKRYSITDTEVIVGADENAAQLVIAGDRMLSPRHARIWQDEQRRWWIEDLQSRNGTWLGVTEQLLDQDCIAFQMGEQRVKVRLS